MVIEDNTTGILFVLLAAVVVSSGCIQNSSTNLNSDFDLSHRDVSLNSSGMDVYQSSMSSVSNVSDYSVDADNRMVLNLPVVSVAVNLTSEGVFEQDYYEVNSSGTLGFEFGEDSNSTEFRSRATSNGNVTTVYKQTMNEENSTEVERYSREDLGVSLESLQGIGVDDASVVGVSNLSGEENLLVNLTVNGSDLVSNSEQVFEVHSLVQESTDEDQMSNLESFDTAEAYLWTGRDDRIPSKFAYYGSAGNGSIQVRSVTNYR